MISKTLQKYILNLQNKKAREKEKLFVAEGKKIVTELLESHLKIESLYAGADFIEKNKILIEKKKIKSHHVTTEDLKKISSLVHPDDALAICQITEHNPEFPDALNQMIVYLDDIRDPGNMGTIIRVCDWFNVPFVFCSKETVDLYNPKTIQASMGSFIRVPVLYTDLFSLLSQLKLKYSQKIPVYGTYVHGENIYEQKVFEPGILIIGNEANGIGKLAEQAINRKIAIPKINTGGPESLNASIATALMLAEFTRRK